MINIGSEVKVKKIGRTKDSKYETAQWNEYNEGEANTKSPSVLYEVKGKLLSDIEKTNILRIERYERNGTEQYGLMTTSPVQKVRDREDYPNRVVVDTQNSIYEIIKLNED